MTVLRPLVTRQTLFFLCILIQAVYSLIHDGGLCPLYTFVHFTNNGMSAWSLWEGEESNPGFHHMASALMAMEHFNARNAAVVSELQDFADCSVQFDLNQSLFFDTETSGHAASQSLYDQQMTPCAIAGPFHDQPALELSAIATAARFPLVAHHAFNVRISSENIHPFSSQVYPDLFASSANLVNFLIEKGRKNYISFLYAVSDTGTQRRETLSLAFDVFGVRSEVYPYFKLPDQDFQVAEPRDILTEMTLMKKNGFRTIVVSMDEPLKELPVVADAAEKLQMNNGDYFWVWYGNFEPIHLRNHTDNMRKVIAGSAWLSPIEENLLERANRYSFLAAWQQQEADFVERVNAMNPIEEGEPGYVFAEKDFFQTSSPAFGAGFLYDAVIAIGLGACLAERNKNSNDTFIKGIEHVDGIRNTDFTGASGRVLIANNGSEALHARLANTVTWAAYNFLPPAAEGEEQTVLTISDAFLPMRNDWIEFDAFIYADGRTVPPDLLRDPPEQNYLSSWVRIFGLSLMTFTLVAAALSAVWVFVRRKSAVVRAAQPPFLYAISLGSAVTASGILTHSYDEGNGWSTTQLSHACMTTPWLLSFGHIFTYGALFSKLWRVNRVLQFARRQIYVIHVIWPAVILFILAMVVLCVWTGVDPLRWVREETNEVTGESIGECQCAHFWAFFVPLVALIFVITILAAFMAWKTKDVDDAYSESKWIFILILAQVEVMFVAAPIIVILYDTSPDGRYLGFVLTFCIFSMSSLFLIIIPKVIAYRKAVAGSNVARTPKRGEQAHGRVTGMALPTQKTNAPPETEESDAPDH